MKSSIKYLNHSSTIVISKLRKPIFYMHFHNLLKRIVSSKLFKSILLPDFRNSLWKMCGKLELLTFIFEMICWLFLGRDLYKSDFFHYHQENDKWSQTAQLINVINSGIQGSLWKFSYCKLNNSKIIQFLSFIDSRFSEY